MAVSTHSKIYYGLKIDTNNRYLDFQEGLTSYVAKLTVGSYTGSKLCTEIKKQMEAVGANTYTVTYDRMTRKFTISSTVNFSLLTFSGVNSAQSSYIVLGYDQNADKTGSSSYLSDTSTGLVYSTQYWVQSFKPTSQNKRAIDGVINKSASGVVEVVKFGNERFMSCEFNFITDILQGKGSIIRTNTNGVRDFLSLMDWLTEKYLIEFMVDESNPNEFQAFILESTEQDQKGLDFELIELYDKSLPEYFRSGILKFRLME